MLLRPVVTPVKSVAIWVCNAFAVLSFALLLNLLFCAASPLVPSFGSRCVAHV